MTTTIDDINFIWKINEKLARAQFRRDIGFAFNKLSQLKIRKIIFAESENSKRQLRSFKCHQKQVKEKKWTISFSKQTEPFSVCIRFRGSPTDREVTRR